MWSDVDIERHLKFGDIRIEPWDEKALQPASVDLRLGNKFIRQASETNPFDLILDTANPNLGESFQDCQIYEECFIVYPQELVLAITKEKISLGNRVVGRLEGKSSLARIGIAVHSTGGFIDPGNQNLNITLEIVNHNRFPIRLHVGMWIAQIAFDDLVTTCRNPYSKERGNRYYADSEPVVSKVSENLK